MRSIQRMYTENLCVQGKEGPMKNKFFDNGCFFELFMNRGFA